MRYMIRRCERERWTQFLRSFWEGWNIVQRLVCHPIAHPQFPPTEQVYTSHLSRKERTGLMNSYHIPMRDSIASMALRECRIAAFGWLAGPLTPGNSTTYIESLVLRSALTRMTFESVLQRNGHVSWKGHESFLNVVSRQCGEFVLEWLRTADFPSTFQ